MKGYNLPDNVSPSDPEAPWDKEEKESEHECTCWDESDERPGECHYLLLSGACGCPLVRLPKCKEL